MSDTTNESPEPEATEPEAVPAADPGRPKHTQGRQELPVDDGDEGDPANEPRRDDGRQDDGRDDVKPDREDPEE